MQRATHILAFFLATTLSACGMSGSPQGATSNSTGSNNSSGTAAADDGDVATQDLSVTVFPQQGLSPVTYHESQSYRMILSLDTAVEGGHQSSDSYEFYVNNNEYDLLLELDD